MAIYENFPRGAMLVSHTVPAGVTLPGDFVIGYMGGGETRSGKFTDLIQAAADSKLPFLAYYENDPGAFLDQYQSLNPDKWREADPLTNWAMKNCINPSLMAGEAMRTVHGVVIGMNKISRKRADTGRVDEFPGGWCIETAAFIAWAIWKLYKLPTWFYIDPKTADTLAARDNEKVVTFLSRLEGISTYVDTMTPGESVTALPYPPDGAQAVIRAAIAPSLGNAPRIDFLCYSTGDYSLTGVTGGVVPLFLYQGSRKALYDLLGWKGGTVTPPPPPTGDGDGDTNTDTTAVMAALAEIKQMLLDIRAHQDDARVTVISGTFTASSNE
jgi:hypothetical protein